MERRIRIEKSETNKYPIKTIEYIQGFLNAYALLNQPNTTLVYEYEIVEFEKSENIIKTLKEKFYIFENQEIKLNEISKIEFLEILQAWFYKNGELHKLNKSAYHQENHLKLCLQMFEDILKIDTFFKIENLNDEHETTYLELGVAYEYLVLKSAEKNFIVYFTYTD